MDAPINPELVNAINSLRVAVMVFLVIMAAFGLAFFVIWMKDRRAERNKASRDTRLEQEAKDTRAARYVATMDALTKQIAKIDKEQATRAEEQGRRISELFSNQHAVCQRHIQTTVNTLHDALQPIATKMQAILDKQSGVLSTANARKLIEDDFETLIIPEIKAICISSIQRNHYMSDKDRVKDKVSQAISSLLYKCAKNLLGYEMAIDPMQFFRLRDGSLFRVTNAVSEFELVELVWAQLRNIHERRAGLKGNESDTSFEYVEVYIPKICHEYFNRCLANATDLYGGETTKSRVA